MRDLIAIPFWGGVCVALLLTPVPSQAAQITSADFSFGFGATDPIQAENAWSTFETFTVNTATTLGDFSFSPALPTSNRFDGSGLLFPFRVITDASADPAATTSAQTGADPGAGFPDGLTVPITASYNGAVPGDASATPDFRLEIEITSISIWGGWHSSSSTPATMAWEDVTPGQPQTSPAVALPFPPGTLTGLDRKALSNYAQLVWDPTDFNTPLAGLNDSFTRTFGIVDRLVAGDLRVADGVEVEGRVHLIYNDTLNPLPGDFDMDDDVDGADFLKWQRDLGDATNLGIWQGAYGDGALAAAAAASAAVPEPTALLLTLLGIVAWASAKATSTSRW